MHNTLFINDKNAFLHRKQRADVLNSEYVLVRKKVWVGKCSACGSRLVKFESKAKRNKHNFCNKKCFSDFKKGKVGD